jgi:hypothetical protein
MIVVAADLAFHRRCDYFILIIKTHKEIKIPMTTIYEKKQRKKRKKYNSMTYTTGDINYNISRFNKAMGSFQW